MDRAAAFLLMLLLAGCSDAKAPPSRAANEMIESPLQNTVISSFDTYPPKPVADANEELVSSQPVPSRSRCAATTSAPEVLEPIGRQVGERSATKKP
jgi:hypothetical protein